jgi:hypothetical protein
VFYFGNGQFTEDSKQPFNILEKDKKISLVAFADGEFNAFSQTDSAHSNEYHLVTNLLIPEAKQLYRLVGEDIAKFMLEIADPAKQQLFLNASVPRGTITLLAANGAVFSFEKNERKGKFPWGWVSDTYGYAEKEFPAKDEKQSTVSAMKAKLLGKPVAKPEPSLIVPAKDTSVPTVLQQKTEETAQLGSPPRDIHSKGALKKWYRHNALNGILPTNWSERPEVPLKSKIKTFKDIPIVADTKPVDSKPKDVEPKHIPVADKPKENPQEHKIPIISVGAKKDIIDKFLKTVDTNSAEILDPKNIQSLENRLPTFCEQVGLKGLEETFRWSFKSLVELGEISKEALATLLMNYRTAYILTLHEKPADEKPIVTEPTRPAQTKKYKF